MFQANNFPILSSALEAGNLFESDESLLRKALNIILNKLSSEIYQGHVRGSELYEKYLTDGVVNQIYCLIECHHLLVRLQSLLNWLLLSPDFTELHNDIVNLENCTSAILVRSFDSGVALLLNDHVRVLIKLARLLIVGRLQYGPISSRMVALYERFIQDIDDWLLKRNKLSEFMESMLWTEIVEAFVEASSNVNFRAIPAEQIEEIALQVKACVIKSAFNVE
jgi:hypothetical protein